MMESRTTLSLPPSLAPNVIQGGNWSRIDRIGHRGSFNRDRWRREEAIVINYLSLRFAAFHVYSAHVPRIVYTAFS